MQRDALDPFEERSAVVVKTLRSGIAVDELSRRGTEMANNGKIGSGCILSGELDVGEA